MIKVDNISKIYKVPKKNYKKTLKNIIFTPNEPKHGVEDISFSVDSGEIVAFAGTNGAGKTTTIKMLSGILTPSRGKINVLGYTPYENRKAFTKEISVLMGQKSVLFYDIPPIESFKFYKDVYSLTKEQFEKRLDLLVEKLDLESLLYIPVRKLSLGQRMKCEIVASLLHDPKIIFLDEPTLGLDIVSKQRILDFFKFLNKKNGTTIFLTTHDINDIDRLCERIIIIDKGKLRYDGSISKIKQVDEFKIVEIIHDSKFEIKDYGNVELSILSKEENRTLVKVNREDLNIVTELLNNSSVMDVNINNISLEEVLKEFYEGNSGKNAYV